MLGRPPTPALPPDDFEPPFEPPKPELPPEATASSSSVPALKQPKVRPLATDAMYRTSAADLDKLIVSDGTRSPALANLGVQNFFDIGGQV
jgi:hypothetical protein